MRSITRCPTCGSKRVRRVVRTWTSVYKGQSYTVPRVPFDECLDCGEKVFDPAAVRKIQSHRPGVSGALEAAAKGSRC